jgi:palmitoyltransferase ZDHHC3/7/25
VCLFRDDEESGPIVRVAGHHKSVSDSDEDNIMIIDCRPFWRKIGVSWPFIDSLWLVKDCCGLVCASFTWFLIAYAEFVVVFIILLPSQNEVHSIINGTIFQFFTALAFLSHLRAMTTDPVSLTCY